MDGHSVASTSMSRHPRQTAQSSTSRLTQGDTSFTRDGIRANGHPIYVTRMPGSYDPAASSSSLHPRKSRTSGRVSGAHEADDSMQSAYYTPGETSFSLPAETARRKRGPRKSAYEAFDEVGFCNDLASRIASELSKKTPRRREVHSTSNGIGNDRGWRGTGGHRGLTVGHSDGQGDRRVESSVQTDVTLHADGTLFDATHDESQYLDAAAGAPDSLSAEQQPHEGGSDEQDEVVDDEDALRPERTERTKAAAEAFLKQVARREEQAPTDKARTLEQQVLAIFGHGETQPEGSDEDSEDASDPANIGVPSDVQMKVSQMLKDGEHENKSHKQLIEMVGEGEYDKDSSQAESSSVEASSESSSEEDEEENDEDNSMEDGQEDAQHARASDGRLTNKDVFYANERVEDVDSEEEEDVEEEEEEEDDEDGDDAMHAAAYDGQAANYKGMSSTSRMLYDNVNPIYDDDYEEPLGNDNDPDMRNQARHNRIGTLLAPPSYNDEEDELPWDEGSDEGENGGNDEQGMPQLLHASYGHSLYQPAATMQDDGEAISISDSDEGDEAIALAREQEHDAQIPVTQGDMQDSESWMPTVQSTGLPVSNSSLNDLLSGVIAAHQAASASGEAWVPPVYDQSAVQGDDLGSSQAVPISANVFEQLGMPGPQPHADDADFTPESAATPLNAFEEKRQEESGLSHPHTEVQQGENSGNDEELPIMSAAESNRRDMPPADAQRLDFAFPFASGLAMDKAEAAAINGITVPLASEEGFSEKAALQTEAEQAVPATEGGEAVDDALKSSGLKKEDMSKSMEATHNLDDEAPPTAPSLGAGMPSDEPSARADHEPEQVLLLDSSLHGETRSPQDKHEPHTPRKPMHASPKRSGRRRPRHSDPNGDLADYVPDEPIDEVSPNRHRLRSASIASSAGLDPEADLSKDHRIMDSGRLLDDVAKEVPEAISEEQEEGTGSDMPVQESVESGMAEDAADANGASESPEKRADYRKRHKREYDRRRKRPKRTAVDGADSLGVADDTEAKAEETSAAQGADIPMHGSDDVQDKTVPEAVTSPRRTRSVARESAETSADAAKAHEKVSAVEARRRSQRHQS